MTTTLVSDRPAVAPTRSNRRTHTGLALVTRVEMRKAVDTRSGLWLLICVAAIGVTGAIVKGSTGSLSGHTFTNISNVVQEFMSILLPIVGILLITSEWSQRTALQTFALVPRRGRVVGAKLLAGILIGLAAAVIGLLFAGLATAFAAHPAGTSAWQGALDVVGAGLLYQSLSVIGGMAFGLLFLSSPVAIVVSFALPIIWNILTSAISTLSGVQNWLNIDTTTGHLLSNDMTPAHWAQLAVSAAVWAGALLIGGLWRLRHKEIA